MLVRDAAAVNTWIPYLRVPTGEARHFTKCYKMRNEKSPK